MEAAAAAPEIEFDEAEHRYSIEGRQIVHVTRVLDHFNEALRSIPEHALEAGRRRGQAVHAAAAFDARGVLNDASCDATTLAYLAGFRQFRDDTGFTPAIVEGRVYHPVLDFAGTLDLGGTLVGKWAQIDIKSGAASALEALQTAAYSDAWEAGGGRPFEKRYVLRLNPDLPRGYRLEPHTGAMDRARWRAMLTTYRFLMEIKR